MWGRAGFKEEIAGGHAWMVSALVGWGWYVYIGSAGSRIWVCDVESGQSVRCLLSGHAGG